jgi:peroxiredoxin
MKRMLIGITFLFVLAIFTVACSGAATDPAESGISADSIDVAGDMTGEMMDSESVEQSTEIVPEVMEEGVISSEDGPAMTGEEPMADMEEEAMMTDDSMALAAWQTLPLTNARTGETFTLSDFAGRTVFVEPMATWCSNCRRQLMNVQQARTSLNDDEVVFIALSVETNISDADLARYADGLGLDWTFAVMSPEMLQELAAAIGRTVANPPSTPHFVIRPDGSVSDLLTGIKSPADILALVSG